LQRLYLFGVHHDATRSATSRRPTYARPWIVAVVHINHLSRTQAPSSPRRDTPGIGSERRLQHVRRERNLTFRRPADTQAIRIQEEARKPARSMKQSWNASLPDRTLRPLRSGIRNTCLGVGECMLYRPDGSSTLPLASVPALRLSTFA
jgi:hypothetical protein